MPYVVDYYNRIGEILGEGGAAYAIIPIGDPRFENAARTTVLTTGAGALDGLTCTYSEARTAFDLPTFYRGRGSVPIVQFNGVDEDLSTPDAAAWTRDDSGANPVSWGFRVRLTTTPNITLMSKWIATEEWVVQIDGNGAVLLQCHNDGAGITVRRRADAGTWLLASRWYSIIVTYNSAGGVNAMNGAKIYINGIVVASSAENNGAYVSMQDVGSAVSIATLAAGAQWIAGQVAGGPCGFFFTHREVSAQDVRAIEIIQQDALTDLPPIQRIRGIWRP